MPLISSQHAVVDDDYNPRNVDDVFLAQGILIECGRIPVEVANQILSIAEYWVRIVEERDDEVVACAKSATIVDILYMSLTITGYMPVKPLRKVVFITRSHDQGWSSSGVGTKGTYHGSYTWFEAGGEAGPLQSLPASDLTPRIVQYNIHASWTPRTHVNTWSVHHNPDDRKWLEQFKTGDKLHLYAKAQFPGWENNVESGRIEAYYACV
ncbi:hypothetical protein WOLCODRAFT_139924 [Wolfiporia cocos MD-104 SS10]|uniref:Uncharacterized protein n=1 Tax=Wolfiporia cocos (strain MD-104) TaxID=742152 RepID=A0A2H3J0N0_WOLCO|nr:hypothetical protein WOLCODRAFT_139924 [Wolfiporia cocos MD-104 SS10]